MSYCRYFIFFLIAFIILGAGQPFKVIADPGKGDLMKFRIDSIYSKDSLDRLNQVTLTLQKANIALNKSQLDSTISLLREITVFDIYEIPADILAKSYYLLGKAYRMQGNTENALRNYLTSIQKLRYTVDYGCRSEVSQELGHIYLENGWASKAVEKFIDAYNVEVSRKNEYKQIELLQMISTIYEQSEDYQNSTTYKEKLLTLYINHNHNHALDLMDVISKEYILLEEYPTAINLQLQILEYNKKRKNFDGQLKTLLNIIGIYQAAQDYEKLYNAVRGFNGLYASLRGSQVTNNGKELKGDLSVILGELSEMWGDLNEHDNYEIALTYFDSAATLFSAIENDFKLSETRLAKAEIYFKLSDYKSSIDHCLLTVDIFNNYKSFLHLIETYELMARSYEKLDRYKLAYQANTNYLIFKDSLNNAKERQMNNLVLQYKENSNKLAFQNLEQSYIQKELDTLSDALLRLDIEKQQKDIELLLTEKTIQELALKNEQLKNITATNEIELLHKQVEAELNEKEIAKLQAENSIREAEIKNQQLKQIKKEQQIASLEQERMVYNLNLQKAKVQRAVYILGITITLFILITLVIGYINVRKSRGKITLKNKQIEEKNKRLEELNMEKNKLIRIVAHDLKNPLTSAITLSDMIHSNRKELPEEHERGISLIRKSLKRMHEMINKILDIKAIDSDKLNLEIEAINAKQVMKHVIELFNRRALKKNIIITEDCEEFFIMADRGYLTQIFENLISNALKFSPFNTCITVKTVELFDKCQIMVKDEGPGFSNHDMNLLFTEYTSLSTKPTGNETGNGLGLSIVKKYAKAMNGRVWCESEPGKGATFILEFDKALELV